MTIIDRELNSLANSVFSTASYSSSLKEKANEYFSHNPKKVKAFKDRIESAKELLKKGDALVHAMYESCCDANDPYLKTYNATDFDSVKKYIARDGKGLKENFKKDSDNSSFFDYKVACVAHNTFDDSELLGVSQLQSSINDDV